ncbi:MAG: nickel pincer cofactor biosynthesis protein LarB [Armatimonadota bacterium]
MDEKQLRALLNDLKRGELDVNEAVAALRRLPFEDLGFAKIDHHRTIRRGLPEVIFCQNKTPEQVAQIAEKMVQAGAVALGTLADDKVYSVLAERFEQVSYDEQARVVSVGKIPEPDDGLMPLVVVSAGTSDIPVARQASLVARAGGVPFTEIFDVGVAGLHRVLSYQDTLQEAGAIVVCAGMEGALPSVVGGLVPAPVIAVPTSVGYGASFKGVAALLGMLNSCAGGVAVVNIDNGFGAGYIGSLICKQSPKQD